MTSAYYATNSNEGTLLVSPGNATGPRHGVRPEGVPGNVYGVNVITSSAVGGNIVLFDPSAVVLADESGLEIDASRQASVQMDSAPASPADATTVLTSFWQSGLVGLRAVRFINWQRSRANAVVYLAGAAYV